MAKISRAKAIRAKCMECSNMSYAEVRKCPVTQCALYDFRMGRYTGENAAKNDDSDDFDDSECCDTDEEETL